MSRPTPEQVYQTLHHLCQNYRLNAEAAIETSQKIGFPHQSRILPNTPITDHTLMEVGEAIFREIFPLLLQIHGSGYWGNKCLGLSTDLFVFLNHLGYKADIVIGEVFVNGTYEYDTKLPLLVHEFQSSNKQGDMPLHCWVTLGDDVVIDAALPHRLIEHYVPLGMPQDQIEPIFVSRVWEMTQALRTVHIPMLVGSDFIARTTNVDPLMKLAGINNMFSR